MGVGTDTNNANVGTTGSDCVISEIRLTAGGVTAGGLPASGQTLSINSYQALYSLIGNTYGGDGSTTFKLPDLRNLAPDHMTYSICVAGIFPSQV